MSLLVKLIVFAVLEAVICKTHTPIVMWHGLLDTCCANDSVGETIADLKRYFPGIHILSLRIGASDAEDVVNSAIMHPDKQIELACGMIQEDPLLAGGYIGMAVSQGSQLLRGLAQRCPDPPMKKLLTFAGQHQGVYGVPDCSVQLPLCRSLRRLLNRILYRKLYQSLIVPATYWHNPLDEDVYRNRSSFLADINNERFINQTYVENLQKLEKFVMVKYTYEETVWPSESSWFGFYKPGQEKEIQPLRESEIYLQDRLGLKKMDEEGKLDFLEAPWHHTDYEWEWFRDNIVKRYLE